MKSVTIRHVAKAAGVSVKTVSRIINDEEAVHPDTRARVQRIIDEMQFRPNPLARSLVAQRTRTIGLIVPDMSNSFFASGVYGCIARAEQHGYHLVVAIGGPSDTETGQLRALLEQRVSGIILWTSALDAPAIRDIMSQANPACPLVFIDCGFDVALEQQILCRSLLVEQRRVGVLATQHLLDEGRRRVAHLADTNWAGRQRRLGYLQTLAAAGLSPEEHWIMDGTAGTIEGGIRATLTVLERRPYPDSIFAFNDAAAVGALLVCRKKKLRVPDDIAIVGVDNTRMAAVTDPPITTMRIYQRETGEQATALLLGLIEHEPARALGSNAQSQGAGVPPPELIIRLSSTLRALPDLSLDDLFDI